MDLSIDSCPPEILAKMFICLTSPELSTLRLVCSFWNDIIENLVGLNVNLNDTKKGNRKFASSVKIRNGIVELMTVTPFFLRFPNALTHLKCSGPPNHFWFLDQVLRLKNLTTLHLSDDFFFLQDLTRRFPPIVSKSYWLPNLKFLKISVPTKSFYVRNQMACGVYPKIEEKLCERVSKNLFCILKVLRSPRLASVQIVDELPRCVTATIQKFQWWGEVFAEFVQYHQYSLEDLTIIKKCIPQPEDPFTCDDLKIPLGLKFLTLHILATDLGTFHYWRALIEAQVNLQVLKLHLSGVFWKRFPIQKFAAGNRKTLKELELILEYDVDSLNPEPESTFDFSILTSCDQLETLRVGPCGYLAPTTSFSLVPQLLPNLTTLYLTFMDISSAELNSIVECENLKTLQLQCLIQIVNGLISSPANSNLVKKFLCMRSLDSLAVDFITTEENREDITKMSMQMFGKVFKGHGFFFPFELEEKSLEGSNTNLRSVPNQLPPGLELLNENQVVEPHERQEEIRQLLPEEELENMTFALRCPCENRKRSIRRLNNCVSRFCIPTMIDFCEDLLKAGKIDLWVHYMDGLISFHQIKDYIPDHLQSQLLLDEDECSCQKYFDEDDDLDNSESKVEGQDSMTSSTDLMMTTSEENVGDILNVREVDELSNDGRKIAQLFSNTSAFELSSKSENISSGFVGDQINFGEEIESDCQLTVDCINSTKLKDLSSQTELLFHPQHLESLDSTTQYEKIFDVDNESQTKFGQSQDMAIQKMFDGTDSSTQNDQIETVNTATQIENTKSDIAIQKLVEGIDKASESELQITVENCTQNEAAIAIQIGTQIDLIKSSNVTTQFEFSCTGSVTQYEEIYFNPDRTESSILQEISFNENGVQADLTLKDTTDNTTQYHVGSCTTVSTQTRTKSTCVSSQTDLIQQDDSLTQCHQGQVQHGETQTEIVDELSLPASVKLTLADFDKDSMTKTEESMDVMAHYDNINFLSDCHGDGAEDNSTKENPTIYPLHIRGKLVKKEMKRTIVNDLLGNVGDCIAKSIGSTSGGQEVTAMAVMLGEDEKPQELGGLMTSEEVVVGGDIVQVDPGKRKKALTVRKYCTIV